MDATWEERKNVAYKEMDLSASSMMDKKETELFACREDADTISWPKGYLLRAILTLSITFVEFVCLERFSGKLFGLPPVTILIIILDFFLSMKHRRKIIKLNLYSGVYNMGIGMIDKNHQSLFNYMQTIKSTPA